MKYKPLRDFLLVTKNEPPKQTSGGLYMPDIVEDKIVTGTVVAAGSGRVTAEGKVVSLEVSVGDKVVFNRSYAVELKSDGETYLLLREDQVFCIAR